MASEKYVFKVIYSTKRIFFVFKTCLGPFLFFSRLRCDFYALTLHCWQRAQKTRDSSVNHSFSCNLGVCSIACVTLIHFLPEPVKVTSLHASWCCVPLSSA